MAEPTESVFKKRVTSKLYERVGDQLASMQTDALAGADFEVHFTAVKDDYGHSNFETLDGTPFRTNIFGQIAPAALGTTMSAKGNHFVARTYKNFKPITDDIRVKDILVLQAPSLSTLLLSNLFTNQLSVLDGIREVDQEEEAVKGEEPTIRNWIKSLSNNDNDVKELINLHMLPKYGKPNNTSKGVSTRIKKRALNDSSELTQPSSQGSHSSNDSTASESSDPKVALGEYYDPYLNADYGGPVFKHVMNKLVQLDVRNPDNELIPPWKFYEALRPGTLILANCSLHCYVMKDLNKKFYQINAHSIRVLDHSDTPLELPVRPIAPIPATHEEPDVPVSSNCKTAFDSFEVNKKQKTSDSSVKVDDTKKRGAIEGDVPTDIPITNKARSKGRGSTKKKDTSTKDKPLDEVDDDFMEVEK